LQIPYRANVGIAARHINSFSHYRGAKKVSIFIDFLLEQIGKMPDWTEFGMSNRSQHNVVNRK
jgi:hypothetical protein